MLIGSTQEQVHLGQSARALLHRVAAEAEVRRLMATSSGFEPEAWSALADLGLVGLIVPERWGGAGGTLPDLGVVLEEMGRRLLPGPFLSTAVLAVQALLEVGDEQACNQFLKPIAAGSAIATLAVTEESGRWSVDDVRTRAAPDPELGWLLSGVKTYVPDGASAGLLLVVAATGSGPGLFAVTGDAPGLTRMSLPTMDQTRKQARLDFDRCPARQLGRPGSIRPAISATLEVAAVACAAEQVGAAMEVLDMVLAHVRSRHQFGKPIGSFQAVQHKCADLALDIEAARSAAYYALRAVGERTPDASAAAGVAKSYCSDMFRRVADTAVQLFGGIALTWEHSIHLYLKRARSSEILFGTPAEHRERLAPLIGL
jgi:alkylation response protein AidB-like acyl-CoA dehydrogenase